MKPSGSLRNKVMLLVLLATFSALMVANGIFLYYDINNFRDTRLNDMKTQTALLSYSSVAALQFDDAEVARDTLELLQLRPSVRAAAIYDERGMLFASYEREGITHEFPALPEVDSILEQDDTLTVFSRILTENQIMGTAYLYADFPVGERVLTYLKMLGASALAAMSVAALVSFWLQSLITRPVHAIVDVARQVVADNDYSLRARKISDDEVGELVDSFNNMLDVIELGTSNLEASNRELEQQFIESTRAQETIVALNAELEHKVRERTQELETSNRELESFCSSVSHDLRGPLRAISGFSKALADELPPDLPKDLKHYLDRIIAGTFRMGQLIEDLLNLSRVSRGGLTRKPVNLSALARSILAEMQSHQPDHKVEISVWDNIHVEADPKLLQIALENLLSNAWKFSSRQPNPLVMMGLIKDGANSIYFVRDNGAGFDMQYADKLFMPFQRLHAMHEYPGTGVGLATVQRIIQRHGGRIWFDSSPGNGAVFYFTLSHEPSVQYPASQSGEILIHLAETTDNNIESQQGGRA